MLSEGACFRRLATDRPLSLEKDVEDIPSKGGRKAAELRLKKKTENEIHILKVFVKGGDIRTI